MQLSHGFIFEFLVIFSSGLCHQLQLRNPLLFLLSTGWVRSFNTVHELSSINKKNHGRKCLGWDLNLGLLGEKRKCYFCAMTPPSYWSSLSSTTLECSMNKLYKKPSRSYLEVCHYSTGWSFFIHGILKHHWERGIPEDKSGPHPLGPIQAIQAIEVFSCLDRASGAVPSARPIACLVMLT